MLIETATIDTILTAASTAPDRKRAAMAISPLLATLRRGLETAKFSGSPRITTYSPPAVVAGERPSLTAERLRHRLHDLHLARAFGTPADVSRVIDETVSEIRVAALGRHLE